MASENPSPPEGFTSFDGPEDDDEVQTIELDAGEVLQGIVLELDEGEHEEYGHWARLRVKDDNRGVVDYFAKGPVKTAVRQERVTVGEPIWIGVDAEPQTFENDDGEEKEFYEHNVALPEADS